MCNAMFVEHVSDTASVVSCVVGTGADAHRHGQHLQNSPAECSTGNRQPLPSSSSPTPLSATFSLCYLEFCWALI